MKKVLAILGSPKKNGNCAKMLNHAMNVAKAKGYEVDFVDLHEVNIAYCKGCMTCKKTRKCVIDDDLHYIREKLSFKDREKDKYIEILFIRLIFNKKAVISDCIIFYKLQKLKFYFIF